jgi:hypothetical protein
VNIKHFHIKSRTTDCVIRSTNAHTLNEPIITQCIESQKTQTAGNQRYNKLKECFELLTARASQESEENFAKLLFIFDTTTKSLYENRLDEVYDKLNDYQLPELDIAINECEEPEQRQCEIQLLEDDQPRCSKTIVDNNTSKAPFVLMNCKNPVGRPSGTQQSATSFGKKLKRKSKKVLENLPKINRLVSSAVITKIKSSVTTTVSSQETESTTTTTTTVTQKTNEVVIINADTDDDADELASL